MPFTTDICDNILKYYFLRSAAAENIFTRPVKNYIALSTNDPEADGGTFKELTIGENGYQRVLLLDRTEEGAHWPDYMSDVADRTVYNEKEIHFNKATADWPTVNGFAIFSAETEGYMVYYAKLDNPVSVPADGVALFDPNTLRISFATQDKTETTDV